uniref:antitoxin Xre/MbcA/ParS toxin-binding domain-containing protein n=1 Tax=Roseivirga sp. TaxID=1964215 RepID=UPI004047BF6B
MEYQRNQSEALPQVLEEPSLVYGHFNYFDLATRDISKNYVKQILNISQLSLSELMDIIPISIDTYKRKNEFNPPVTEKILEIEEVYKTGLNAFGESFHTWMNTPNQAMAGAIPKKLLSNSFGVRKLLDEIGRIEHGVLA